MGKESNRAVSYRMETISIRQLSAEISLGLRAPVTIRAGEVHGGIPGKQLSKMYAAIAAYNIAIAARKEHIV